MFIDLSQDINDFERGERELKRISDISYRGLLNFF